MQIIKKNVICIMEQLMFPIEAQSVFIDAMDIISADSGATSWLKDLIEQYEISEDSFDYKGMLLEWEVIGTELGIHHHTMAMLIFLCLCVPLRNRYLVRGLDLKVWHDSIMDLRYKLEECRLVYGTVGTFVAPWYSGFFDMTRFALGRLQFEITYTKEEYIVGGVCIREGSPAINIHIPRTGTRLDHNEVLNSYRAAADWFSAIFPEGEALFTCNSWLLDPWNLTVLNPTSNLANFINDFEIVQVYSYENYNELWRLFDCNYNGNPAILPRNTSLRCAYAERVARSELTGAGRGFFRMQDGKILK